MPEVSLLDDWRARRERWATRPPPGQEGHAGALVHVFDYLLSRYQDSPEALKPARFKMDPTVTFNNRAIVILHHVGKGKSAGTKTQDQARSRASKILGRIKETNPQESLKAPEVSLAEHTGAVDLMHSLKWLGEDIRNVVHVPFTLAGHIERYQRIFSKLTAEEQNAVLNGLYKALLSEVYFDNHEEIVKLFYNLNHPHSPNYIHLAWREWAPLGGAHYKLFERFFRTRRYSDSSADCMRIELASSESEIRVCALSLLQTIGSVQDVGLLSDLFASTQSDDYPGERQAWLKAMHVLADPNRPCELLDDIDSP